LSQARAIATVEKREEKSLEKESSLNIKIEKGQDKKLRSKSKQKRFVNETLSEDKLITKSFETLVDFNKTEQPKGSRMTQTINSNSTGKLLNKVNQGMPIEDLLNLGRALSVVFDRDTQKRV
jgi:hypothetical protein